MNERISVAQRLLNFATRTAIRILPKEVKAVVKKYKKYRNGKGGRARKSEATSTTTRTTRTTPQLITTAAPTVARSSSTNSNSIPVPASREKRMKSVKANKKKSSESSQLGSTSGIPPPSPSPPAEVAAPFSAQVKTTPVVVEQIKKKPLEEGGIAEDAKTNKKASTTSSDKTKNDSATAEENGNNKIRFQRYNIRLEDIIKFRERLSELEIQQLSLPPTWSKTISEVDTKAQNDIQKARDEAADAQILADNLKDQLDESRRLLEAAKTKNERYTREADAQRQDYAQLQQQLSDTQAKLKETHEKCGDLESQAQEQDKNIADLKQKYVQERDARTRAEHALKQQEGETARQLLLKQAEITQIVVEQRAQLENKNDEIANMLQELRKIDENYKEALAKKVADLEAIYARRYADHEEQLHSLQDEVKDKDKEIEKLKAQLQDALARLAALEAEGAKDKNDLGKIRQAYKDADKELKDKEVKFVVEDFEPEFIKYDGLLMIEEKRIAGIQQQKAAMDENNN